MTEKTTTVQIIMPQHCNGYKKPRLFGGQMMAWIDVIGAVAARRYTGKAVTTVSIDNLTFLKPAYLNDTMVQERAQQMANDMAQRLQNQGIPFETYLNWMGTNAKDFVEQQKQQAEKTIRQELALAKIAELEGLTVTDEDKENELKKAADQYGVDVETIESFMDTEMFTDGILYSKAADFLIANSTALPEPEPEEAPAGEPEEKPAEVDAGEPEAAPAEEAPAEEKAEE